MRKIIFVIGNYKNGGMAMRATNLANEFVECGYEVDILVTGEMSQKPFFVAKDKVNIIQLDDYCCEHNKNTKDTRARSRKIWRLKKSRYFSRFVPILDKKLEHRINFLRAGERYRYYFLDNPETVVIVFGITYLKGTLSATEKLGCRVYYAEKNAPELECPKYSDSFENTINMLELVNAVIVQTQKAKEYYSEFLDNVYVINNPVKTDLPQSFRGQRSKRIVNFCRISEQKNLELLMDAFIKLHNDYSDYRVEIYGNIVCESEQHYKDKLVRRAKELGLSDCFRILPPVGNVHEKVLDAAMFVSSSDYEGLSNSMIEAMAIGLPCICTDCLGGGTREVMTDRVDGLIVPMKDADALYFAMKDYVDNPQLAMQCSQNAVKIKERLHIEKIASLWLGVINNETEY